MSRNFTLGIHLARLIFANSLQIKDLLVHGLKIA